jgi:nucleoside-diphosphate-sugar epimerase
MSADKNSRLAVVAVLIVVVMAVAMFYKPGDADAAASGSKGGFATLSGSEGYPAPVMKYAELPPYPRKSHVLITGGAGFIGSQLGWHLHKLGHEVTLIDNMRFGYDDNLVVDGKRFGRFVLGDILDPRTWKYFENVDVIFHFAALSALPVCQSHPRDTMNINVGGVANVLEGARLKNVKRFIFASTSATYENTKTDKTEGVLSEDMAVDPHLLYSLSKQQGELLVRAVAASYGMDTVIMRFFNVYGPHQDFRRTSPPFTSYIIRELVNKQTPVLHSDGEQKRDYVHVDDLMRLAKLCMTEAAAVGETFNVASGTTHSVNAMYKMVQDMLKIHIKPRYHSAANFWDAYPEMFKGDRPIKLEILVKEVNKRTVGSYEKAKRLLGWEPKVSMEDGLKEMIGFVAGAIKDGKVGVHTPTAWKS